MRLKRLIRGLLFYGTIDWARASDGLKAPPPRPAERSKLAPSRDLTIIKPRGKPLPRADEGKPVPLTPAKPLVAEPVGLAPANGSLKRRKRHRHNGVRISPFDALHGDSERSLIRRLFGRED